MAKYRTKRDIVIPAGTVLEPPPISSTRYGSDFEAVIGIGKDHTSYWSMNVVEGLNAGILEPVGGAA